MNLSTRDMARIGYLMLREGTWTGAADTTDPAARRRVSHGQPLGVVGLVDEAHCGSACLERTAPSRDPMLQH